MARIGNIRGVFHQDNVTSVVTRQNLWELGWEVLMHPPYSPDLAPSDYHLFLTFQNFLSDKKLGSREDCENQLPDFFANKAQNFKERGILKLPLKCSFANPTPLAHADTSRDVLRRGGTTQGVRR
ncbi:histone-lysine N-methyltransferase SETMAR [Trichonephila clavipes]|nr:histone-lysine N-methyltransferase SETMAR [Trichonephila clavipes]